MCAKDLVCPDGPWTISAEASADGRTLSIRRADGWLLADVYGATPREARDLAERFVKGGNATPECGNNDPSVATFRETLQAVYADAVNGKPLGRLTMARVCAVLALDACRGRTP